MFVLAACGGTVATPAPATTTTAAAATTTPDPTEPPATPAVTEPPLEALDLLWEAGGDTEPGTPYPGTYSPAVDPQTGDVWVTASASDVIWTFGADGTFKHSFGQPGKGHGEFEFTRPACRDCPGAGALAFAPDGSLFVADVGNHRIQKFDPSHGFEREWGEFGAADGQFADAIQIATNGREVFVSDDVRRDVQVFDLDGEYLRTLPTTGWLAVDAAGDVFISNEGGLSRYHGSEQSGEPIQLPDYRGAHHIGLAAADDGRLFFDYQDDRTGEAIGFGAIDPSTGAGQTWSTGGETLAIADDVLYQANYVSPGWPEAILRAYRLPGP
jgi:sugar lactone lactonase YvrE